MKQNKRFFVATATASLSLFAFTARGGWSETPAAPKQQPMMAASTSRPPLDEPLDYSKLFSITYDYHDIVKAKTYKMSDDNIARALRIARARHIPFASVVAAVARGELLSNVAQGTNLSHLEKEKDELAAFEAAYFSTGWNAQRRNNIDYLLAKAAQDAAMMNKSMKTKAMK